MLVVGGGPSGAACAYWLAEAGHDVLVVEKKNYPREKTCGDGLTPRSVSQLDDMGLADELARHHRFAGLRSVAFGRTLELRWPEHPGFPATATSSPATTSTSGGPAGREGRRHAVGGQPRPSARSSTTGLVGGRRW